MAALLPDSATPANPVLLGFDPGRDKCGVAVRLADGQIATHAVVPAAGAIAHLQALCQHWTVTQVVMGDQTTAKHWLAQLQTALPDIPIALVDERYTTLEARDRYWHLYPPRGLGRLLPQSLRKIPRPVDDIVAILLIERYLAQATVGE